MKNPPSFVARMNAPTFRHTLIKRRVTNDVEEGGGHQNPFCRSA